MKHVAWTGSAIRINRRHFKVKLFKKESFWTYANFCWHHPVISNLKKLLRCHIHTYFFQKDINLDGHILKASATKLMFYIKLKHLIYFKHRSRGGTGAMIVDLGPY